MLLAVLLFPAACRKKEQAGGEGQKTITVLGTIAEGQNEKRLELCFDPFEERTGITVKYNGSNEFENIIYVRAKGGNPPDVAIFPQPGGVATLARRGHLIPLSEETRRSVEKNYTDGWKEIMQVDGTYYGVIHRINVKSIVWYPKKAWEAKGYTIPKTWEELEALCRQMVSEGETPWSVGIESGGSTGWPATDWIEDIMLRMAGPDVYDQWVNHEIPFTDPRVKNAVEILADMWFTEGYVYGGRETIPTLNFGDAAKRLFDDPPKAWMHRQGSFIINFFPEEIQNNLDDEVGVFGLPTINEEYGTPVLGGGDIFVAFTDSPEVHSFMKYMSTKEAGEPWQRVGGSLFAYKDQNLDLYPTETERKQAELAATAKVFRFDGSDMMPSEVGAGSFWKEVTNIVTGKDIDRALADIEESWPEE